MRTVQSENEPQAREHAAAKVSVDSHEATPFDESATPALAELRITETFRGDIEGTSTVRALQIQLGDGRVSQVSLQRVRGRIGQRTGSFVLQAKARSPTARSRPAGSWCPAPGPKGSLACAAKAGSKAGSGRAPTRCWITGSNSRRCHRVSR